MANYKVEKDPLYILRANEGETRHLGEMFKHLDPKDPNLDFEIYVSMKLATGDALEVPFEFQKDLLDLVSKCAEQIDYKFKLFIIYDDGEVEMFTQSEHKKLQLI